VIVEVKLRRGTAYGTALKAVTPRKQNAIRLTVPARTVVW
jgi:Holliday junction resolvase-like predicted endonuclease